MANLFGLLVILSCCLFVAICFGTADSKYIDAEQSGLETFNRRPDSSYVYDSAKELPTSRVKRQGVPGAPYAADANDPYIRELANSALAEIDFRSNARYKQKIVRIVEARRQVVAGTKAYFTLELGHTTCRKGEASDINYCPLQEDLGTQTCTAEVVDTPWLQLREVSNVSCSSI